MNILAESGPDRATRNWDW